MKHSLAITIITALIFAGMAWLIASGELAFARDDTAQALVVIDNVRTHCPRSIETDIRTLPTQSTALSALTSQCNEQAHCEVDSTLLLGKDGRSDDCTAEIIIYYHCRDQLSADDTPPPKSLPPVFMYEGQVAQLSCQR